MSALVFAPPQLHLSTATPKKPKHNFKRTNFSVATTPTIQSNFSDPFVLQLAETIEDSISPSPFPSPFLQKLRDSSSQSLLSTPWPSRKDEPFRFTDTSFIKKSHIHPISNPPQPHHLPSISKYTDLPNLVIVDGFILNSMSNSSTLPDGVLVGSLLSYEIAERVSLSFDDFQWGDLFWSINGLGAPDVAVVYVPAGVRVENPIHLRYVSVEGGEMGSNKLPVSNPRVVVVVEEGGEVGIIEEFVSVGSGDKCYWANSVFEVMIEEGAKVKHSYIQSQSLNSAHIKWTSVRQVSSCCIRCFLFYDFTTFSPELAKFSV